MWGALRWRHGRLLLVLAGIAGMAALLTWMVPARPLLAAGASPAASASPPAATDLAPKYRAWLDEVAALISERERQVFLSLTRDYQRDDFIQRFWDVRDPYPETPRNELRDAWEERLKLAQERFGNVVEDRARVLLIHGEPAHVFHSRCLEGGAAAGGSGPTTARRTCAVASRWSSSRTARATRRPLAAVGAERGGRRAADAAGARPEPGGSRTSTALADCPDGDEIAGYLSQAIDEGQLEARGQVVPKPGDEWLSSFAAASTDLPPGAQPLPAELELSFPGRAGSRTVVQGLLRVPRDAAAPGSACRTRSASTASWSTARCCGRTSCSSTSATGSSLPEAQAARPAAGPWASRRGSPWSSSAISRPGAYTLVLKLEDTGGKRF